MLRILAIMAPSMAASMSASSNTMKGALPPSSIAGLTTLSAASCRSLRPTSVEPVKETTRTRGSCNMVLTTLPDERDGMTLTAPAGTPASCRIGISASMVSGVSEAGLSTTVQPAASAGPILRAATIRGRHMPLSHQQRDTGRSVLHNHTRARRRPVVELPEIAHPFLGIPAEECGRVGHLAARVRQRLAVLDRDELRQPLGVAHD